MYVLLHVTQTENMSNFRTNIDLLTHAQTVCIKNCWTKDSRVTIFFFVSQGAGEAVDTPTKFTSPHYQRLLDDLWRMSTVARRNTPPFSDNGPEIAIGLSLIDIMSLDRDTGMTQMLTWDRYVSLLRVWHALGGNFYRGSCIGWQNFRFSCAIPAVINLIGVARIK